MTNFIGIQIPDDLSQKILQFREERQYTYVIPHIKLASQVLVGNIPGTTHKLESFCLSQAEFHVQIAEPRTRGTQILYLAVLSDEIVVLRDQLIEHFQITNASPVYHPHITLMRQHAGQPRLDLGLYLEQAREIFTKKPVFKVEELTLFTQDSPEQPFYAAESVRLMGR